MKKFFDLKRTKMIDEAAFNHQPMPVIKAVGIFVIVFLIAQLLMGFFTSIPLTVYMFSDGRLLEASTDYLNNLISIEEYNLITAEVLSQTPTWVTLVSLFLYVVIIAVAIYYCVKREKRTVASMGIRRGKALIEYLAGLLIGAVLFFLAFLIPWLTGLITPELNSEGFMPVILLFFLAFAVQGASEELLVRGYFMVSLARDTKASVAIGVSSCAFALLHLGNAGLNLIALINIALMGVFLGVYIFKRGNLWGACAIHTAWNFVQGNIFGVSVSGISSLPSVFNIKINSDLDALTGGVFGLEASLCTTLVLLIAVVLVFLIPQNKNETSEVEVEYFA